MLLQPCLRLPCTIHRSVCSYQLGRADVRRRFAVKHNCVYDLHDIPCAASQQFMQVEVGVDRLGQALSERSIVWG